MARKVVDTHHHLCSAKYIEDMRAIGHMQPFVESVLRLGCPEKSLEDMDKAGVTRSFISLTLPGVWFGDAAQARRLARETNEYFAKVVGDHPDRYGFFAALPLPDIDGSLKEIEYALGTLKADGVGLFTSYDDIYLGDAKFLPMFEELNRRKAVVYTHPKSAKCCENILPGITDSIIEYGTDTTRTITSLVFNGTTTRCPNIEFLFSHGGGTLPFLLWRFLGLARAPQFREKLPHGPVHEFRRFYYDLAQAASPPAAAALRKLVDVSQILFGTDWPYATSGAHIEGIANCGFSERELEAICSENAARILPRSRG